MSVQAGLIHWRATAIHGHPCRESEPLAKFESGSTKKRPRIPARFWLPVSMALWLVVPSAPAQEIIANIKARGELRCGVGEGIAGFSERDEAGRWSGFNVDFCRAVAAALFGKAEKVAFIPLKASTRFPALQSRRVDLLMRNTTWTFARETAFGVQFPAILFYDGQGFMVP